VLSRFHAAGPSSGDVVGEIPRRIRIAGIKGCAQQRRLEPRVAGVVARARSQATS